MDNKEIAVEFFKGNEKFIRKIIRSDLEMYSRTFDESGVWYDREISLMETIIEIHKEEISLNINLSKSSTPFKKLEWLVEIDNLINFYKESNLLYPDKFKNLHSYLKIMFGHDFDLNNLSNYGYEQHKHTSSFMRIIVENLTRQYNEEANIITKIEKIKRF